jgi:gliding motility-associated-like protein
MKAQIKLWCLLLLAVFALEPAKATHIVGGEVTYKCLGNNRYEIRLDIYQDCINGDPNAIAQDSPAFIGIFYGNGTRYDLDTALGRSFPNLRVPTNFNNSCVNNPPPTCLNKISFIKTYTLPPSPTGYYIIYQRCCRNQNIINIVDPGAVGATYYAIIPPSTSQCNNSAVFKNYPPQIICINNPLIYDHSATDADGDSLSYEFCTAYQGGSASNAKPLPYSTQFSPVAYLAPYTAINPMGPPGGSSPALQINPVTGLITGTPNTLGRFVVTVCCHEWRNRVKINTVTREFQFVVTNCSKAVVANIPQYSSEFNTYIVQCKGKSVHFANLSTGANNNTGSPYFWDFGVEGLNSDTSNLKEPDFTYPDTGIYQVKLVVNRGSTCSDSIVRFVKIYPEFHADFEIEGLACPKTPIQFVNKVQSTFQPVTFYNWDFGDGSSSSDANPVHSYDTGGDFVVRFKAGNIKGCTDTASKAYSVLRFYPFAGNDTIIVKGESIVFNARGGDIYTWSPGTWLNNTNSRNPIGYYPDTTRLDYVVHIATETGCEGDDTINVWVVGQSAIFVPSGFSPNGDGRNDLLKPIGIGYRNINFFRVFNRWGQQVFYGTAFDEGWDGSFQGHTSDIGTYYWVLSITDRFGKEHTLKGDSALIR